MLERRNLIEQEESKLYNSFNPSFLYIENIRNFKRFKSLHDIELCIVKMNFESDEIKFLKKLVAQNPNVEFWISSNESSRENILLMNKIMVKNLVSDPFDFPLVEEFFNKQNINYMKSKSSPSASYSSLSGLKVMIVDDNTMNIQLLEEILANLDLGIFSFAKPKEAYNAILKEKFDLFLLDIMMPEMSGFELAKKIKKTPHHKNTPIIFLSALSDSQNKIKGYDLGSYAYIEKPFDINIVRSQIYNLLKNQKIQEVFDSAKEIFMATVVHDLKTPINAEISALNLLLGNNFGELDSSQKEIIGDILNSTKFMKNMVDNLLAKNKIESGNMNLVKELYSMKEVIEHCIELTKYILCDKNQKVIFNCKVQDPLIKIDFMEMKRAIHNLIANASAYSPEGSDILIEIFNSEENLAITVRDFGIGISLESQNDVFLQYVSSAKESKTLGTGLGLYIAKNIVEAHGGEIRLQSKLGDGTTVSIYLPIYTKV